eukprot:4809582-Amphidinium_carterae.2
MDDYLDDDDARINLGTSTAWAGKVCHFCIWLGCLNMGATTQTIGVQGCPGAVAGSPTFRLMLM